MAEKARLPCLIKSPVLYSHFIQSRPENVQFSPTGCNWAQRAIIAEPLCCKALQMNATQCNIMEYNRSVRAPFHILSFCLAFLLVLFHLFPVFDVPSAKPDTHIDNDSLPVSPILDHLYWLSFRDSKTFRIVPWALVFASSKNDALAKSSTDDLFVVTARHHIANGLVPRV